MSELTSSSVTVHPPLNRNEPLSPQQDGGEVRAQQVPERNDLTTLTPLRAHYLKKALFQLQFRRELDALTASHPAHQSTLSYLGTPFTPPPKDAPHIELPFIKYIFRQFVLTFPFMAAAPKDFYSEKLQPFVSSVLSRNLSPSTLFDDVDAPGNSDQVSRLKFIAKLERNFAVFLGNATKLAEKEEVVRLSQKDLDRLEMLAHKRQAKQARSAGFFDVNIIGVRTVVDRGRVRKSAHDEFIIRTQRSHFKDTYVVRRYGDFRTLANELRKAHPEEVISDPPAKDRTIMSAPNSPTSSPPSMTPPYAVRTRTPSSMPTSMSSPIGSASSSNFGPMMPIGDWRPSSTTSANPAKLVREKNRLTLRSYLHTLMSNRTIASSPVLRSFLLSDPTELSSEEREDARRREDADRVREDGRKRFAKEVAARVEVLREAVKGIKAEIMGKEEGLTHIFSVVKETPNVRDLPPSYKGVVEWARVSLASTVFHQYVASDKASVSFASLKRTHGLMPYFMLKGALKISNPVGMIRSVLDLFLAQPFGGHSLLQRLFTSSLSEEVKALEGHIEAVKDKVDDPIICEKVRQFVYAPKDIQDWFRTTAATNKMNILVVILRSGEPPVLNRAQMQRVAHAIKAHAAYLASRDQLDDSDDDDGPTNEDAWLFEDLKILGQLYSRLRDREQLIELIFESFTADLLKDMITIFYSPLAQVYRAASIADSLGDLQNFINDLIKTVEQVDELSQMDSRATVNTFIDLVARHEQSFYNFVHKVHSKGETLFKSIMRWIELFLTLNREGLGARLSLECLLPHTGQERSDVMKEVDAVALYHYKLKVIHENKIRIRFGKVQARLNNQDADADDEATRAMLDGVAGEISFGELVKGDAMDLAAEGTDEDESDEESSEYETDSEGSSESSESLPVTPAPVVSRSQTLPHPAPILPAPKRSTAQTTNERPSRLRSRSVVTLGTYQQAMQSPEPPPLPPLPARARERSRQDASTPTLDGKPSLHRSRSMPLKSLVKGKKKKVQETLKPPDLAHIPKLLPLFTEMLRPHLRLRRD